MHHPQPCQQLRGGHQIPHDRNTTVSHLAS
jgi:hypothetical protein